jgi:pSer/pThr/pTyr-binding forkhead associated (FHA) protein
MDVQTDFLQTLCRPEPLEEDALEVLNGPEDGRLFPLGTGAATIGRLESSEVALELDGSVSRTHARLTREEGRYSIEDLGSTHGTSVNGQTIHAKTELKDGDEILIGSTLLRLRREET